MPVAGEENLVARAKACRLCPKMQEIAADLFEKLSQIDSPGPFKDLAVELQCAHPFSGSISMTGYGRMAIFSRTRSKRSADNGRFCAISIRVDEFDREEISPCKSPYTC
jgi:hypothetical protein